MTPRRCRVTGWAGALRIALFSVAVSYAGLVPAPTCWASPAADTPEEISRRALEAFHQKDYARAEALLRKQLEARPDSFIAPYNLACCRAMQNDPEGAAEWIAKAIELGFCDRRQLEADPTLAPARDHPKFRAILDHWGEILDAQRDFLVQRAAAQFKGRDYTDARDDRLRLCFRSAFNEKALKEAREEMTRIADWARAELFPEILNPEKVKDDAWVMVVLPTRSDFMRWAASVYGEAAVQGSSMIGGAYEHDAKQLVSMDIGPTLRHEFLHVLHWRDCTRRGQAHPIWIMEGLCSLAEDYDLEGGKVRPATSWRTNMAQRMERVKNLQPIEKLAAMTPLQFSGRRPLANYAQARTFFLYLHDQGKLKAWYEHYTENFAADPTGVESIVAVLDLPIANVNRNYRAWLRGLPPVPEVIKSGSASLGIEVDAGSGEGPVVASVARNARHMLDPATSLRKGDIITSIGGRAVRDIAELVRVLSGFGVGEEVEVEYRRGRNFASTRIRLVPR